MTLVHILRRRNYISCAHLQGERYSIGDMHIQGGEDIELIRKLYFGVQCMIKLLTCFSSCLLNRNLLVTLYLSFNHLIYLEGLMRFVQVFQVIGISFQVHHSFQIQVWMSFVIVPKLTFKSRVCYRVFLSQNSQRWRL